LSLKGFSIPFSGRGEMLGFGNFAPLSRFSNASTAAANYWPVRGAPSHHAFVAEKKWN
jgi:hypothetical protein